MEASYITIYNAKEEDRMKALEFKNVFCDSFILFRFFSNEHQILAFSFVAKILTEYMAT